MKKTERIEYLAKKYRREDDKIYFSAKRLGVECEWYEHPEVCLDIYTWKQCYVNSRNTKEAIIEALDDAVQAEITYDEDDTVSEAKKVCEAHGYTLPELTGTEKQVKWAEDIRAAMVTRLFRLWDLRVYTDMELLAMTRKEGLDKKYPSCTFCKEAVERFEARAAKSGCWPFEKTYKAIFDYIIGQDSASYWIDNRDESVRLYTRSNIIWHAMKAIEKQSGRRLIADAACGLKDNQDYEKEREEKKVREEQKALAEQKAKEEQEARIVSVKYRDLKNDVWKGKIEENAPGYFGRQPKTVWDSYDSTTKTILVYAVNMEAKEEIEEYYRKREEKAKAIPKEVRDFKNGYIDEYTITPPTINADDIDNAVPEELKND